MICVKMLRKEIIMFNKAKTKIEILQELKKMHKELKSLGPIPRGKDIYDYSVKFFNIIVSFQDKFALNKDMFPKSIKSADVLTKHINNAGRQEYGWVRARRGETVTLHNLYLGNVYGIWTKPAAYFKESKENDVQQIIQNQLHSFISSHRDPMLELLSDILDNNKVNPILEKALSTSKQK